jgi:hypothetical protein
VWRFFFDIVKIVQHETHNFFIHCNFFMKFHLGKLLVFFAIFALFISPHSLFLISNETEEPLLILPLTEEEQEFEPNDTTLHTKETVESNNTIPSRKITFSPQDRERIEAYTIRIGRRYNAATLRLELLIERTESRLIKLEKEIETQELMNELEQVKQRIQASKRFTHQGLVTLTEMYESDNTRTTFHTAKNQLNQSKLELQNAQTQLQSIISKTKMALLRQQRSEIEL